MSRSLVIASLLASSTATIYFEDRFTTGMDNWVPSDWKANDMGKWTHTAGQWFSDEAETKGISTTDDLKHHAISAKMTSPATSVSH
jgi:calreticulin